MQFINLKMIQYRLLTKFWKMS